jgi:hypothetical protein
MIQYNIINMVSGSVDPQICELTASTSNVATRCFNARGHYVEETCAHIDISSRGDKQTLARVQGIYLLK